MGAMRRWPLSAPCCRCEGKPAQDSFACCLSLFWVCIALACLLVLCSYGRETALATERTVLQVLFTASLFICLTIVSASPGLLAHSVQLWAALATEHAVLHVRYTACLFIFIALPLLARPLYSYGRCAT